MNISKESKLALVDELIAKLGLSRDEVIDYLTKSPFLVKVDIKSYPKINIGQVTAGMFWFEDDTFSFERIIAKKIKAVVEQVSHDIIYGDLTASELFDITEKRVNWDEAQKFFEEFSYPCKENEEIVWYDENLMKEVYDTYSTVRKAFEELHKPCRKSLSYWTSSEYSKYRAMVLDFYDRGCWDVSKNEYHYVRPTIALKIS